MLAEPTAMVFRLRREMGAWLKQWAWRRALAAWRAEHPDADYALFYAWYARARLRSGWHRPQTLGLDNNRDFQRRRALAMRALLVELGLRPEHALLDYGCGSLWVGEALIEYLLPDRYEGLDVVDDFWREALGRLDPALVAAKRPRLGLVGSDLDSPARPPDFVLATAVLMHVPPEGLVGFFARLLALAAGRTRILVGHELDRGDGLRGTVWRHGRATVERQLAALGGRLAPLGHAAPIPGGRSRIVLFEIVPGAAPPA